MAARSAPASCLDPGGKESPDRCRNPAVPRDTACCCRWCWWYYCQRHLLSYQHNLRLPGWWYYCQRHLLSYQHSQS